MVYAQGRPRESFPSTFGETPIFCLVSPDLASLLPSLLRGLATFFRGPGKRGGWEGGAIVSKVLDAHGWLACKIMSASFALDFRFTPIAVLAYF